MTTQETTRGTVTYCTDQQIAEAYATHGSVQKAGKALGLSASRAHARLQKLGLTKPPNLFNEEEKERLQLEYWIAAETAKLDELAADMGRTKQFICRQARILGLTDKKRRKTWLATWKYVGEESARIFFEQFKRSRFNLGQYCLRKRYDDLGFSRCMQKHFPDEWEHVIEAKQTKQTKYRYGRQFEYRTRDDLKRRGYYTMRAAASKGPVDLAAFKFGKLLLVQCKRNGVLRIEEWNNLFTLAASCGAIPVLASSPLGKGCVYEKIVAPKDGLRGRQPKEKFEP